MKTRGDVRITVWHLEGGALLLVHGWKPVKEHMADVQVVHGENVETYIERVEDHLRTVKALRDCLEAQK